MPRKTPDALAKEGYHHGNLTDALVAAVRTLMERDGRAHISISEACKIAGVSTAAPYRHFRDKQHILEAVSASGFEELGARMREAKAAGGPDKAQRIVAIGKAYVAFAVANPELFRLLFGSNPDVKLNEDVDSCGQRCFGVLIETVAEYLGESATQDNIHGLALPLWTFVHGASSLEIDGDYKVAKAEVDVDQLVRDATLALLAQHPPT